MDSTTMRAQLLHVRQGSSEANTNVRMFHFMDEMARRIDAITEKLGMVYWDNCAACESPFEVQMDEKYIWRCTTCGVAFD
jgi:DNA-directed RNA polymerase subunit RPC12/RpoP